MSGMIDKMENTPNIKYDNSLLQNMKERFNSLREVEKYEYYIKELKKGSGNDINIEGLEKIRDYFKAKVSSSL